MRSCPPCGTRLSEEVRICPRCRPAAVSSPKQDRTRAPAWELAVVLGLIALALANHLLAMKLVPAVVSALMLLGLLFRTGWAFWWTVLATLLGIPLSFYSFQEPGPIAVAIACNLLIAGLLISCKVREAY